MRARIDITEVEQATKIRAKYLRAIENEEWGLLPGATFTKSFIRGYADYLGIDARSLVEEYKFRYEHPSDVEVRTVSPGLRRDRRGLRGGAPRGGPPRWAITLALVVLLLGALFAVGSLGGNGDDDDGSPFTTPTVARAAPAGRTDGRRRAAARRPARRAPARTEAGLRLIPTSDLYVCLVDQDGTVLIPGVIYSAGQQVPVRRAAAMRVTLGNSNVEMRVNGAAVEVPASSSAVGFAITPRGAARLAEDQLPTCT